MFRESYCSNSTFVTLKFLNAYKVEYLLNYATNNLNLNIKIPKKELIFL